jgi:GNAT superfamily N-acetyltransferase
MVEYSWRGPFKSEEVEQLHAQCFDRPADFTWDWYAQVEEHSLGWVDAREDGRLIGWVNVAWDGAGHAFIVDTIVDHAHRRQGVATALVHEATKRAREADCEWLHVDFEDHLRSFYFNACGFTSTPAGVIRL